MIVFCCSTWLGLSARKKNCKRSVCANMLILYVCTYCSLSIHYSCCLYYANYSLYNPLLAAETWYKVAAVIGVGQKFLET